MDKPKSIMDAIKITNPVPFARLRPELCIPARDFRDMIVVGALDEADEYNPAIIREIVRNSEPWANELASAYGDIGAWLRQDRPVYMTRAMIEAVNDRLGQYRKIHFKMSVDGEPMDVVFGPPRAHNEGIDQAALQIEFPMIFDQARPGPAAPNTQGS